MIKKVLRSSGGRRGGWGAEESGASSSVLLDPQIIKIGPPAGVRFPKVADGRHSQVRYFINWDCLNVSIQMRLKDQHIPAALPF